MGDSASDTDSHGFNLSRNSFNLGTSKQVETIWLVRSCAGSCCCRRLFSIRGNIRITIFAGSTMFNFKFTDELVELVAGPVLVVVASQFFLAKLQKSW